MVCVFLISKSSSCCFLVRIKGWYAVFKGEKVSMGHFKEIEIGFTNIYVLRIGSNKGRERGINRYEIWTYIKIVF